MKQYKKPEIEITVAVLDDIVTASVTYSAHSNDTPYATIPIAPGIPSYGTPGF